MFLIKEKIEDLLYILNIVDKTIKEVDAKIL